MQKETEVKNRISQIAKMHLLTLLYLNRMRILVPTKFIEQEIKMKRIKIELKWAVKNISR